MPNTRSQQHRVSTTHKKYQRSVLFIVATAIAILVAIFVLNGSDRESVWLYIVSIWLVSLIAIETYTKKK